MNSSNNEVSGKYTQNAVAAKPGLRFLDHPPGLFVISGTEMWERLSFYGLQVILAYYIYYAAGDGGLGLSTSTALGIVGTYGGAVYILQPLGGWISDRLIAARYIVLGGGVLIMLGHITLAISPGLNGLVTGLGFLVVGTGLLLPNANAMVDGLYIDRPQKRDPGYALYYGAVMIGALVGPLITGLLQDQIGFHTAFSAAAFGMALGLLIFLFGWKSLPDTAAVVPHPLAREDRAKAMGVAVAVLVLVALITFFFVNLENANSVITIAILLVAIAYFVVMLASPGVDKQEKINVIAYIPIFIAAIIFWTLVLQLFTTFAVYADSRVDMQIASINIPPAYISTFEVIAGIVFTVIVSALWQRLGNRQPSTPTKLMLGLLLMAVAYGAFALISLSFGDQTINIWPVIFGMCLFGLAEVTFAPQLYSITMQCAPKLFTTQMMAIEGLSLALGASLAGLVGELYTNMASKWAFFALCVGITIAAVLLLFSCIPLFKRSGLTVIK